jgi:alpha-N-arabinofuranosidase
MSLPSCVRRLQLPLLLSLAAALGVNAQSPLAIYSDGLQSGFQDWSWVNDRNLQNANPVHSGTYSLRATANAWEGISFYHATYSLVSYSNLSFWAHGGSTGGQRLQVYFSYPDNSNGPMISLPAGLPTNTWQQYTISLSSLGVATATNLHRINIQLTSLGTAGTFYLDDIQFNPDAIPGLVNVSVNTTQALRTVNERHFGVNLTMWDEYFDPPHHTTTAALLQEMGATVVRMPGGSLSDQYHWTSGTTLSNAWQWAASFADMVRATTNAGAQAFIVVNYGSGTPEEAAAWVRHANLTNQLGFKYWEIGNECYGTWEYDTNSLPNHAYTYAVRATNYIAKMKAADPTIKIGVVAAPGENSYANGYTDHPAINPRTGQTNYGWTPVLLQTLKQLGVTPDYLIHHHYPQWTDPNNVASSPVNDVTLLQSTGNWAADAADLRQMITDYFGAGGTDIELVVTENNSDSGKPGRQSTSLVNGIYYADSLAKLLQTEFKGFVWWDLRNGADYGGFFGAALYGWRNFGDLGMVNESSTRLPPFYAAKLMQWFARPGDKILSTASDYSGLAAYAARQANGSVTLLVLNKLGFTNLTAQISLNGFVPQAAATLRFYGIPNDEAARTNAPVIAQDITVNSFVSASTNFAHSFPPYSLTLFTLTPAAPQLTALSAAAGQFVFQLQGQSDVRYVIQSSSDLINWTPQATNTLTGSTLNLTNAIATSPPQKYWRAVWQP